MRFLVALFLLIGSACPQAREPDPVFDPRSEFILPADAGARPRLDRTLDISVGISPKTENPPSVVRIIIAGQSAYLALNIVVDRFFERDQSKARNHVFFDAQNAAQFSDINPERAFTYALAEDELSNKISEVISTYKPDKVLMIFAAHGGVGTGNLCYKSKTSCTLGKDKLWQVLTNLKTPSQVLLLPISCYNGIIAQSLIGLSKTNPLGYPVSIVHLTQPTEACGFDATNRIARQEVFFNTDFIGTPFIKWANESDRVNRLLNMSTLNQWLSILNELNFVSPPYQISHFADFAGEIKLADFDLQPILHVEPVPLEFKKLGLKNPTISEILNAILPAPMRDLARSVRIIPEES